MNGQPATTWPDVFTHLLAGEDLSAEAAAWAMDQVMRGEASPTQLSAFLVALRAKGESVAEMRGLADMMLAHALRFEVEGPALDIVGTGGDRAHTVNISTMSSIVANGAGVRVVKHGNRAASSKSGSADVLEALGVSLDLSPEAVHETFRRCGITFCFAMTFHPSFRHSGVVRRELGIPTAFNFLGPLTNPAQPRYGAIGVANDRMAPLLAGVLADRGQVAAVFRGDDGLDEITTTTTTTVWWVQDGQVHQFTLDPERLGVPRHPIEALRGDDAAFNAGVARDLLAGKTGAVRDAVLLNAGTALAVVQAGEDSRVPTSEEEFHASVRAGMERAAAAIDDGSAQHALDGWVAATAG